MWGRPEIAAQLRALFAVAALVTLLTALVLGLAFVADPGRSFSIRAAGVLLALGALAGIAALLRWASGFGWRYDRPRDGASASEVFLTGAVSVVAITFLVEPLRAAGVVVGLVVPFAVLVWLRYERVRGFFLALGAVGSLTMILALAAGAAYALARLSG